MESKKSHNPKSDTPLPPLMLTPSEIESLRQDLQQASKWMRQQLIEEEQNLSKKNLSR
ncbi:MULTISPECIES: hypothetical protein [Cardiobacteriaceae]|uniref:hypothetical protein n=1 Tax=Cardiobacteriaceae TaxID=868 RepID=UPI001300D6A6|nr:MULTISPECIES: hypothetical protein [Cardiobacteriaceae]